MKKMPIFAMLAAATLSSVALASEPARQLRISLDGIDLTTQRGMDAAQRRIDHATADFCHDGLAHLSDDRRVVERRCRTTMRAGALTQLEDRRLQQLAAR
jgi:UrcA family protein